MPARATAPYPYHRWPKVARAGAALLSIAPHYNRAAIDALCRVTERFLGVCPDVSPRAPGLWSTADARKHLPASPCALLLELRNGSQDVPLALELDPELAGAAIDRLLGGEGDGSAYALLPPDPLELGLLTYLAARVSAGQGDLAVRGVATSVEALCEAITRAEDAFVVWPALVQLGPELAGGARLMLGPEAVQALRSRAAAEGCFERVAAIELPIEAIAASLQLRREELASLQPGDVVIPPRCTLTHSDHGFVGQVSLRPTGSSRPGLSCDCLERALRVSHEHRSPHRETAKMGRTEKPQDGMGQVAGYALAGDAPVEIELSLARFTMTVEQLSQLAPGQILHTGRPVGERVELLAGGHCVALGELVDVEGEIGVRVDRVNAGST